MSRNKFYDKIILQIKQRFKDETALSILDNMQSVYEAKDNDYSATGLPMGNLRKCEDAGIDAWRGCLVRIGDKMSRLENFLKEKEYLVISEKAEDGIRDFCLSRGLGDVYKRQLQASIPASSHLRRLPIGRPVAE